MLHTDSSSTTDVQTPGSPPHNARPLGHARWPLVAAIAALSGCSDDPVSLGGAVAVDRSALSSYAAVWEGYVEAHTFRSGSDRVRLVLNEDGQGTIRFGEAAPRPMPTDADDPFPDLESIFVEMLLTEKFHEGVEHDIASVLVEEDRLRARTAPTNVYGDAACALQTPVGPACEREDCPYTCVSNQQGAYAFRDGRCFATADDTEVSCKKLDLCWGVCECTSTECYARTPGDAIVLDGALDEAGTQLVGSLDTHTVRLTRQP
jgi:hypothetical protein